MSDPWPVQTFRVQTIYGALTSQPLIRLSLDDVEIALMSPEDATELAMSLLQASQASLLDAFIMSFMQQHVGTSVTEAAEFMQRFREWRLGREVT